jgi:hypothetical protein
MHSTARRCGYPSVSIRAAREPARGLAGELSLARTVLRRRRSTTSPPPPGPAALVAGLGATRPDRGPGWLGVSPPESATAPGRRSWPGPAPPARAPLGREAGWSNGGPLPCLCAVGQCAAVSSYGHQLGCSRVCWSVGGLLAVLIRGPVGRVGIAGDGSRTSMAAGGSPVGADSDGQQAACRSYGPSPGRARAVVKLAVNLRRGRRAVTSVRPADGGGRAVAPGERRQV